MITRYTVALPILAGVAVGAAAVQTLHAQAKLPAYVVAEIDVTNAEPYDKQYVRRPRKPRPSRVTQPILSSAAAPADRPAARP